MLQLKRVYDTATTDDGYRVLVDRLWPRGLSKERACIDVWLKNIAPSTELRQWFGHKPDRFTEFQTRYRQELAHNPAVAELNQILATHQTVTLLYAAKDTVHNQAVVLQKFLAGHDLR